VRPDNEEEDVITREIIRIAMAIHTELGPGLLESIYEYFLYYELVSAGFVVERQKPIPVEYRGRRVDLGFRLDLLVNSEVIIEIKAVEKFDPIHEAQILSYLRLSGIDRGLLMNFHAESLRKGIRRFSFSKRRSLGGLRARGG
jgi:GxxExxY protein